MRNISSNPYRQCSRFLIYLLLLREQLIHVQSQRLVFRYKEVH